MTDNSANKVEMKSLDDLFGLKDFGGTKEDSGTKDTIKVLELDKLVSFRNHPFKVCEDDTLGSDPNAFAIPSFVVRARPCFR